MSSTHPTIAVGTIAPGATSHASFTIQVDPDAAPNSTTITADITSTTPLQPPKPVALTIAITPQTTTTTTTSPPAPTPIGPDPSAAQPITANPSFTG